MNARRRKQIATYAVAAMLGGQLMSPRAFAANENDKRQDESRHHREYRTATPIKHVIVLIGENRTFDNVYGTYVPKHGQHVANLLSSGIVKADGSPGPNRALAKQFQLSTINPVSYFISTDKLIAPNKTAYAPFLPTPEAGSAPAVAVTLAQFQKDPAVAAPPFDAHTFSAALLHTLSPVIVPGDLPLLTSGATGLANCTTDPTEPPSPCAAPDTRVANYNALPNTVFPIEGTKLPYDSYTGDMVHRFYHMWQQSDCDVAHATPNNPSGCLNDLYPFVGVARGDDSGSNAMGFYNVQKGDAQVFKRLADEYTMSDNYHQPVMGGTAVQHTMLMTGDQIFWEPSGSIPAQPPVSSIVDPTPKSATNVAFTRDQRWTKCGDPLQPGRVADHAVSPVPSVAAGSPRRRTASRAGST